LFNQETNQKQIIVLLVVATIGGKCNPRSGNPPQKKRQPE